MKQLAYYVALPKALILTFSMILVFTSCSEDVMEEFSGENDNETTEIDDTPLEVNETPCEYDLSSLNDGETLKIDCSIDLEGKEVSLPPNVTLLYEGGEITNGALIFQGGKIDGNLLNINLQVSGEVSLAEDNFTFYPERWAIVQGSVGIDEATDNRLNINTAIELVKSLSGSIFNIVPMDAYFDVEDYDEIGASSHPLAIRIPSDFHLNMSDQTYLRVLPNNAPWYALISIYLTDNSKISGGHLIGDRWEHDYSPNGSSRKHHGYGFVVYIKGAHHATLDNVEISAGAGDGIIIEARAPRNPDGSITGDNKTSEDIKILNSTISENRRNNISVVDANGVLIDNCKILDAAKGDKVVDSDGNEVYSSAGIIPKNGIDLEAARTRNEDGTLNELEKIENVIIRNSEFVGNTLADVNIFTASYVTIQNNYFDGFIGNVASHDILIENNTLEARENVTWAINVRSFIDPFGDELNYNYEIRNNSFSNYGKALLMGGKDQKVINNKFDQCITGIGIRNGLENSIFQENEIVSQLNGSYGYSSRGINVTNVKIVDEVIDVKLHPIKLREITNKGSDQFAITVSSSELRTGNVEYPFHISDSEDIGIYNNILNAKIQVINSINIIQEGNILN